MTLFPIQDTFVRGEISPRLHARASLELYRGALAKCENFLTLPHGGIRKRGGSRFVGAVKHEDRYTRLIEFKFSEDQAYALEVGHLYVRVWAYGGYVTEFASPWAEEHLSELQYVQSADVMWVVHPLYSPRKIIRHDATVWTVEAIDFRDGPFGAQNFDEAVTVYASAETGTVTLTASSGIFSATDIGRLFRIEIESYEDVQPWEPNGVITADNTEIFGKLCRYDGNIYKIVSSGFAPEGWRWGATPPTHLRGVEKDGPIAPDPTYNANVGVQLEYLHSGFGVAHIAGYTSPTQVTANVVSRFPSSAVGSSDASYLWSFGAFGPASNPVAVALFEERLILASKLSLYGSKTADFDSFRIGEKDDDALEFLLAANEANDIVWLSDVGGFLVVGTIGGVRALSGSGIDEALTPSSFKIRSSATHRCSSIRPLNAGQAFLYVINGDRSVAEMALNSTNRFESVDAMQISEHIAKIGGGIVSASYQETPDSMAWLVLGNGELAGFTYQRDQEVRGFHRHLLGYATSSGAYGEIQNVVVTPGQSGADDVWMIVRRTINGVARQFIEMLQPAFEYGAAKDVFSVDCGLTYTGAAVGTVTGLGHLEGELVEGLADGRQFPSQLKVTGGAITLPDGQTASTIHVGLPYEAIADTLELDVGAKDGSLIGRRKRVTRVYLSLLGTDLDGLEISSLIKGRWEKAKLPSHAVPDGTVQLFTGNIDVPVDDSWSGQARIRIRHRGTGPCTIRSLTPAYDFEP